MQELDVGEGHPAQLLRPVVAVAEGHLAGVDLLQAAVEGRDAENGGKHRGGALTGRILAARPNGNSFSSPGLVKHQSCGFRSSCWPIPEVPNRPVLKIDL